MRLIGDQVSSVRFQPRQERRRCHQNSFFWLLMTVLLITAPADAQQQPRKIFRIGFLDPSTASGSAVLFDAFRQELSKLGWIEGKNITIEYRFAEQKRER